MEKLNKILALTRGILKKAVIKLQDFFVFDDETYGPQISVRITSQGYKNWVGHKQHGDLYMFLQDMHIGIMPYTHTSQSDSSPTLSVTIEPENETNKKLLSDMLDDRGYRHDLADAFCRFVRTTAQILFTYGKVGYEIVYERNQDETIEKINLVSIYPLSLFKMHTYYFQIVPWWVAKKCRVKAGIRMIPKSRIIFIQFPNPLGSRRKYIRTLKQIVRMGQDLPPNFCIEAMKQDLDTGFNFQEYLRGRYIEKAHITKRFGWHQGKNPDDNVLEYKSMHRNLRFAYSQALVRKSITDSVNNFLRESEIFNEQIIVSGIPTTSDIERELELLRQGGLSFTDQYKRTNV